MSVQLLGECKRKLLGSLGKLDRILQMYDSAPLEKCFQDTCRADAVIKDTREAVGKHRGDYQKIAQRLKEINEKFSSALSA